MANEKGWDQTSSGLLARRPRGPSSDSAQPWNQVIPGGWNRQGHIDWLYRKPLGKYAQDFTLPTMPPVTIASVAVRDGRTVRVTFTSSLWVPTTGTAGALNPANWSFVGQVGFIGGVAIIPVAAVIAESVTLISSAVVDVVVSDDFSPGRTYTITASTAIAGVLGSGNSATFVGPVPSAPSNRDFDVTTFFPRMNLAEDDSKDLIKLLYVFKDVITLHLDRIDRWTDIIDYDRAPPAFLDLLLQDLGYPFAFPLVELDKRRLCSLLVAMYKQKGTAPGIKNAIRFFCGYESDILWPDNIRLGGWILDQSSLDDTTILGESQYYVPSLHGTDLLSVFANLFNFYVKVGKPNSIPLTADENDRIRQIVDFMMPGHEHRVGLAAVLPPPLNPVATAGAGQISLTWSSVTNAAGYSVFWSKTADVHPLSPDGAIDPDNASPYVISGVPAGETRFAVICARDSFGVNGVASAIVSATAT